MTAITKREFLDSFEMVPIKDYVRGVVYVQEMTSAALDGKFIPLTDKENNLVTELPRIREMIAKDYFQYFGDSPEENKRYLGIVLEVMTDRLLANGVNATWRETAMKAFLETVRKMSLTRSDVDLFYINTLVGSGIFPSRQAVEKAVKEEQ